MDATNLSAADTLIGERVVPRTKQMHTAKAKAFAKYYTEQLDKEFSVPVERDDILAFFGWFISQKHKNDPPAISTVQLYKSALKWHYTELKLIMDPAINQELNTLLKGYQYHSTSDGCLTSSWRGRCACSKASTTFRSRATSCWLSSSSIQRASTSSSSHGPSSSCNGTSSPGPPWCRR